jgi:predicted ArsR family transcriptional regulator
VRSADTEQSPRGPDDPPVGMGLDCWGLSYLERLGILYVAEIRLTIVMELYSREMGVQQFYDTVGGSSYMSVRRHFEKLVEHGWLRWVQDAPTGKKGRPEALYRATEQVLIDTETWRTIPVSMRDGFTVMLLEEMGMRLRESLQSGLADAKDDRVSAFKTFEVDERGWCQAHSAVERCFKTLRDLQIDAKRRLDRSPERSSLMVVNLAAYEAPGPEPRGSAVALPRAELDLPPRPWPERIGKVFSDRLNFAIVDELNRAALTPAQLRETLEETSTQGILRRCQRLSKLGWAVNVGTETGGRLYGASAYRFRAASPNVSERDIIERVPSRLRKGKSWEVFQPFIASSLAAVEAGTFNNRDDRHLSMSPILVDEIGWEQVSEALSLYQKTLRGLEEETRRRLGKNSKGELFPAAFLMDSYRAPFRQIRQ